MSEERSETESPEAEERAIREETADMDSTAGRMEEKIDELGDDIKDAKQTARQRQDAPDEEIVAGDWEDEASGAHQGADAVEAVSSDEDAGEADRDENG